MAGNKKSDGLPAVALSMGDPDGIGPEVAEAAAADERVQAACRPVLFRPAGRGGPAAAVESLEEATRAVIEGRCRALVTAPVSKERIAGVVPGFTGHTDWLADRAGVRRGDVVMIFVGPTVRTACVTRHLPLADVPAALDERAVAWSVLVVWGHLRWDLGIDGPRVAVAGLNPHASDGGLLGGEERRVIAPAVARARSAVARLEGSGSIEGPLAADAAFRDHVQGGFDAVVAMFHDQATIAAKMADPLRSVNVTAGLPFVRTSPDHGTAFGIASTGRADPGGMVEAVLLAARLARRDDGLIHRLSELRSALGYP